MPSQAVMDKIIGAAPNDHLQDVEEGEGTFLNTREWKYASFFNRVKQSVGMHWDPNAQLRRRDPTGSIYGGTRPLHDAERDAGSGRAWSRTSTWRRAAAWTSWTWRPSPRSSARSPSPTRRRACWTADATVRFSFGFFLEMGGGPRMRLFRQSN